MNDGLSREEWCREVHGTEKTQVYKVYRPYRNVHISILYQRHGQFAQGTNLSLQGTFFNDSGCSLDDVAVRARSGREDAAWCDF